VTRFWAKRGIGFRFPARQRNFSLFQNIRTVHGTHRVIYSIRTEVPVQGLKWTGNKSDHSPPSGMAQVQIHLLPQLLQWHFFFCKFKLLIKDKGVTSGAVSSGVKRHVISYCKGSYTGAPRNVCTPVINMMMTLIIVYWFQFLQCSVIGKANPLRSLTAPGVWSS